MFNADYYILKEVMEVENLIPYKIIFDVKKDIAKLSSYDLSYFDFKDGLKYQILYDKESRDYWKSNFIDLQIDWSKIDSLTQKKNFSAYCDVVRGRSSLVPGLGANLLESVLKNTKWNTISERDLTVAQQREWNSLGKIIFSWTCCSQKRV